MTPARYENDGNGQDPCMTDLNQNRKEVKSLTSQILSAKTETKIANWNVRTLFRYGKLAQLLRKCEVYQLNIQGVSEMRWTGSGKLCSEGKTMFYSGHEEQEELA